MLALPTPIAQFRCGLADRASLAGRGRKRSVEYDVRRAVIAIHMRRGKRKLRSNALITTPQCVFVQFSRLSGIIAHAEQIVDRVLILFPAQAIMRQRRSRRHPRCSTFFQSRVKVRDQRRNLVLSRLRFCLWRHLAAVDFFQGLRPLMRVHA